MAIILLVPNSSAILYINFGSDSDANALESNHQNVTSYKKNNKKI